MREADQSFREFIYQYPVQVSIEDARAEWAPLTPEERELASAAIKVQRTWPHMCGDPRFIPRPQTWLRKRRWTDRLPGQADVPDFVFPDWFTGGWPKVKELQRYREIGKQLPDLVTELLSQIDALAQKDIS